MTKNSQVVPSAPVAFTSQVTVQVALRFICARQLRFSGPMGFWSMV